jgi:hypothetical protein
VASIALATNYILLIIINRSSMRHNLSFSQFLTSQVVLYILSVQFNRIILHIKICHAAAKCNWIVFVKLHLVNWTISLLRTICYRSLACTSLFLCLYINLYLNLSEYFSLYFLLVYADDVGLVLFVQEPTLAEFESLLWFETLAVPIYRMTL